MVSPSRCPPWQPERPGPTRREPRRARRSYTTRRDVTLPPSEADDLYGSALMRLKDFQRPLTTVICGLVRFGINDFSLAHRPTGFRRLDRCNVFLSPRAGCVAPPAQAPPGDTRRAVVDLCPFDQAIDRVLDLAGRLGRQTQWGRVGGVVAEPLPSQTRASGITALGSSHARFAQAA